MVRCAGIKVRCALQGAELGGWHRGQRKRAHALAHGQVFRDTEVCLDEGNQQVCNVVRIVDGCLGTDAWIAFSVFKIGVRRELASCCDFQHVMGVHQKVIHDDCLVLTDGC